MVGKAGLEPGTSASRTILPANGTHRPREVTPPDIQQLVDSWAEAKAPRTVDRQFDVLRALFAYAVRRDWLACTPCRSIKLPAVDGTDDGRSTWTTSSPWPGRSIVVTRQWSGSAPCSAPPLGGGRRSHRRLARPSRQHGHRDLPAPAETVGSAPRSHTAGRRRFAIPGELSSVLAAHLASSDLTAADADRLVFTVPGGGPLDYSHWRRRVWLPGVEAAGLDEAGFHDLHRANASALVAGGVDVKTAQARLGHADPRLTLSVYAQVVPEPTGLRPGRSTGRSSRGQMRPAPRAVTPPCGARAEPERCQYETLQRPA